MKSLEFRNVFFAPDGRGKIGENCRQGRKIVVSRKHLREMIQQNPSIGLEIPVIDVAPEREI